MKQFILREMPDERGHIRLSGDDYHYLVRVRRLKPGAAFTALLPNGEQAEAAITDGVDRGGGTLTARVSRPVSAAREDGLRPQTPARSIPPIVLFQALPKGDKMDLIARQAAEGGVSEIIPFVSEFSVHAAAGSGGGSGRLERWRRIIREARQQSGSALATAIAAPKSFNEMLAHWKRLRAAANGTAVAFILHEKHPDYNTNGTDAGNALEQGSFHRYLYSECTLAALAVGPEGGFSSGEVLNFLEAGFHPVTMGETVLRTETAALYGAAAIRILLLEKAAWTVKQ
ncbi:MAG: 16S rRNA (uracil(1498)-N(3))-methyltransferase [Treponema sp.]|jgi:16S rRNA (uracil1498-N3)-methyltransferase|nr:16S rRNA (uracil(1498)-N(3))-methyltransferase [Treponema sp.]